MKNLLMLLCIFTLTFMMSCSNETTPVTPPVTTVGINLMPLAAGNYWIQAVNDLDTLGAVLTTQTDTLTSSATMTYKSKAAATVINTNGGIKDTTYIASEGSKVYLSAITYEKILNGFASAFLTNFNIKLSTDWVKIADYDAATWSEPETQLKDVPFVFNLFTGTINGTVKINGKKGTNELATLNSKAYTANGYDLDVVFEGAATIMFGGQTFKDAAIIKVSVAQKYWFIDKVGLYKSKNSNTVVSLTITDPTLTNIVPSSTQQFGGRNATTTSFKLN